MVFFACLFVCLLVFDGLSVGFFFWFGLVWFLGDRGVCVCSYYYFIFFSLIYITNDSFVIVNLVAAVSSSISS